MRLTSTQFGAVVERDGATCHGLLAHRSSPCDGCGLRRTESATACWSAFDTADGYLLAEAARLSDDLAQVTTQILPDEALEVLLRTKIARIAREHGLSPRERAVFRLILCGQSRDAIASALGIRPRTAKFHEANLLRKLGAASRQDVLRILLE